MLDRAAFRIARAVIEPRDSGVGDRAGAHRAGFERDPQITVLQPIVADRGGGGANRQHLGVRGRIVERARGVRRGRDDAAVEHHHRADRHFTGGTGGGGGIECGAHEKGHGDHDRPHAPVRRESLLTAW